MKVVSAQEMARIEALAYKAGAKEEAFMDTAGHKIAEKVLAYFQKTPHLKTIIVLCGKGNNAGDGLVCAKELLHKKIAVEAWHFTPLGSGSELCQKKAAEFAAAGGGIHFVDDPRGIEWSKSALFVDGLFGTGFKGSVSGIFYDVIEMLNQSKASIISIDIPSGINGTTGEIGNIAVKASQTIFLGLPKTGCFLGSAWNYVGDIYVENFGLEQNYIDQAQPDFILIEHETAAKLLPPIERNRHKYQAGYVVGLAGSPGMPGAAILSSLSCLRSGAGMMLLLHLKAMEAELAAAPYELVRVSYDFTDLEKIVDKLNHAAANFIGPGIGQNDEMAHLIANLLPKLQKKCVIDADALNIIANKSLQIPSGSIITPHHGEMMRLLHLDKDKKIPEQELHRLCQKCADDHKIVIVLKGAPTFIFSNEGPPHVNIRGSPGMATAGSGDVLTGIVAAMLSQKMAPIEAAILAVYLHALAGEQAALERTTYGMIAGDIINCLADAIKSIIPFNKAS